MKIIKKLKKIGNSNFLLIPKDVMESLGLQENGKVKMYIDEDEIVIEKYTEGCN